MPSESPDSEGYHRRDHRDKLGSPSHIRHKRHKHKHDHNRVKREREHHAVRHRSRSPHRDSRDKHYQQHSVKREHGEHRRHPVKREHRDEGYDRAERGGRERDLNERERNNRRREDNRRQRDQQGDDPNWTGTQSGAAATNSEEKEKDKDKPDFALSGKLTEDTNTYKGVVIKYNQPEEARKPRKKWRFYPFKGDEALPVLHIHRQSAFLFGRDRRIADLPVDHPSCSKQHAVLQYRLVDYARDDGTKGRRVKPYIIDLDSANGTFVNNKKVDPSRYVELFERDVIKFGFSSREYVLLHDKVDTSEVVDEGVDEDGE